MTKESRAVSRLMLLHPSQAPSYYDNGFNRAVQWAVAILEGRGKVVKKHGQYMFIGDDEAMR